MILALAKPRIWLALFVALHVQAQGPGSEESARDAFKKGVEAFQKQDFAAAAKSLDLVPELGGYRRRGLAQSLCKAEAGKSVIPHRGIGRSLDI